MLSPVTSPLAAAGELPPAPTDAPAARPGSPIARAAPAGRPAVAAARTATAAAAKGSPASRSSKASKAGASGAGYAKAAAGAAAQASKASKASASAKATGPLAFLEDPKLSVEEKLLRLLAYLNDRWNKDLDGKLKELRSGGGAKPSSSSGASSGSRKSGLGGALGPVVSFAKAAFPQLGVAADVLGNPIVRGVLSKVSGPALAALATASGLPTLAPRALRYGPELVAAAAGIAATDGKAGGAGTPSAGGGGTASGASTSGGTAGAIGSDRDAQLKLMEIQRIMDQQKEMFSLVSNLLRTGHDARMAVIGNVR
jgi:hypothetical protein